MFSRFSLVWLFETLWTEARQAPMSVGSSRQEYEWVTLPSSRESSLPGIEPTALKFPALAGGFFTTSATWEAQTPSYRGPSRCSGSPNTSCVLVMFPWVWNRQWGVSLRDSCRIHGRRRRFNSRTKDSFSHPELWVDFYLKWKWEKKLLT